MTPEPLTGSSDVGLEGTISGCACVTSSSSSSSKDRLVDTFAGFVAGAEKEEGGGPDDGGLEMSLGLCGLRGSSSGGAKVLMKDADTSERRVEARLELLTNLNGKSRQFTSSTV